MTQTASFKDKLKSAFSLFKWELKSCSGTLVVYTILAAVFTTVILTLTLLSGTTAVEESDASYVYFPLASVSLFTNPGIITDRTGENFTSAKAFQFGSTNMIFLLTIIFTIIYTIRVFSYMHNKRKTDLYGSLPIGRMTMYFTKCVTALIFTIVPALVFIGIICIISICLGQPITNETLMLCIKLLLGSLACISSYGVLAVCCGTTINTVLMFIATCIAYPVSMAFVSSIIKSFFLGLYSDFLDKGFVRNALNPLAAYFGENIIYWLIFTVICFAAGGLLVRKRKFECAQSKFAIYLPCHIIKILISFFMGAFLGTLFGSLNVLNYGYFGFLFGFVLGSVSAFVICHLIFYKGFEKLLITSISLGVLIVTVAGLMAFCNIDPFGYNYFVPKIDDVQSAGYIDYSKCWVNDNNIGRIARNSAEDFDDTSSISDIITAHNSYIGNNKLESKDKFANVWSGLFPNKIMNEYIGIDDDNISFAYKLKNGTTVTRIYPHYYYSDNITYYYYDDSLNETITKSNVYIDKYSAIFNKAPEKINGFSLELPGKGEYTLYYTIPRSSKAKIEDRQTIIDAFKKDIEADNGKAYRAVDKSGDDYSYMTTDKYRENVVCTISIGVSLNDYDDLYYMSSSESYDIPKSYTNTIQALKDIGILKDNNTANKKSQYFVNYSYTD